MRAEILFVQRQLARLARDAETLAQTSQRNHAAHLAEIAGDLDMAARGFPDWERLVEDAELLRALTPGLECTRAATFRRVADDIEETALSFGEATVR